MTHDAMMRCPVPAGCPAPTCAGHAVQDDVDLRAAQPGEQVWQPHG